MGVGGLLKLIEDPKNFDACCTPPRPLAGTLLVHGYQLLFGLCRNFEVDCLHGWQYPKLRSAIIEFFDTLRRSGVDPIVVLDGNCEQDPLPALERKSETMREFQEKLERYVHAHKYQELQRIQSVFMMPSVTSVLSSTLEELSIPFYVVEGVPAIVRLVNHYGCPLLAYDTGYFVRNLNGGYIFYTHLKWRNASPPTARVFNHHRFVQHFRLRDPALSLLLPAILGDGATIPYLYHGTVRRMMESTYSDSTPYETNAMRRCLVVLEYVTRFASYRSFIDEIPRMPIGRQAAEALRDNCQKANGHYQIASEVSPEDLMKTATIQCSGGHELPQWLLKQYRKNRFFRFPLGAATVSVSQLPHHLIGDLEQPPPLGMSKPIREITYGLIAGLVRPATWKITEYHRSNTEKGEELKYAAHEAVIKSVPDQFQDLSVLNIGKLGKEERESRAAEMISFVLRCPSEVIDQFDTWEDNSWVLVVAATRYWATHKLVQNTPNHTQVVKALVYSFVQCFARAQPQEQDAAAVASSLAAPGSSVPIPESWKEPNWLQAYHAYAQWHGVYISTIALSQLLMEPFEAISLAFLYDGRLALYYATHKKGERFVDSAVEKLASEHKELYDKLIAAVLPHDPFTFM